MCRLLKQQMNRDDSWIALCDLHPHQNAFRLFSLCSFLSPPELHLPQRVVLWVQLRSFLRWRRFAASFWVITGHYWAFVYRASEYWTFDESVQGSAILIIFWTCDVWHHFESPATFEDSWRQCDNLDDGGAWKCWVSHCSFILYKDE